MRDGLFVCRKLRVCGRVENYNLVDFPLREIGKIKKGDFAICGWRLRALP